MPEHKEIKELLSSTNINYYNCKAILEILMETEKGSKNILGMYTSQRISGTSICPFDPKLYPLLTITILDWRKIISMYEKDNCYLGEATQFLSQAVQYEIPGLRKQIARLEKNVTGMCQS